MCIVITHPLTAYCGGNILTRAFVKGLKVFFEKIVGKGLNLFVTYTCSLSCLAVTAGAHVRIWELEQAATNSPSDGKSVPNFCGFF